MRLSLNHLNVSFSGQQQSWLGRALMACCALLTLVFFGSTTGLPAQVTNGTVIEIEGKTLLAKAGTDDWKPGKIGDQLAPGDRFRTLERSRAVLRLTDLSLLRLGELSHIQMPTATARRGGVHFLRGILYYFHRDKPGTMPVSTPSAHAVVLGTEFVLSVHETGATRLTMIDGQVVLTNSAGRLQYDSGSSGAATLESTPPVRLPTLAPASAMQWILYYPGVLDPAELGLTTPPAELKPSADAYIQGDILEALHRWPANRVSVEPAEQVYHAGLLLAAGLIEPARALVTPLVQAAPGGASASRPTRLARALLRLVTLVQTGESRADSEPELATEWLVESLARQARSDLPNARAAALAATERSPGFAFAWAQLAELEFGSGRASATMNAAQYSLALAPRHARALVVRGFALAAQNRFAQAQQSFEEAIAINGALGDAWLGRGLCRIRRGEFTAGRDDLQVAVVVEPQRAILRSYLAKAWNESSDTAHADHELALARRFDPHDPTAWLYSALLRQEQNRINEGIADLEHSVALNDHRSLFRSRLLLDQDRGVRGANLAALYRDAGMSDVGVRAAARAVASDYANPSAHLFLANSYSSLRDPNLVQLRYETPAVSEYLVANLLAPVGASGLSPLISQQEYSAMFDRNRVGIASETGYTSDGGWSQAASHYGVLDDLSFAVDASWRRRPGHRPNSSLEQFVGTGQFKLQLGPRTSAYVLASYAQVESGDVRSYYDDRQASAGFRLREWQEPNVFAGVHHQWAPGLHTLFLGARLNDTLEVTEPLAAIRTLVRDGTGDLTGLVNPADSVFSLHYRSLFNAWSAELQQIAQIRRHLLLGGGRIQTGELITRAVLDRDPFAFPPVFEDPAARARFADPVERGSVYGYWHWQIADSLRSIFGGAFDWMRYPGNFDAPPIQNGSEEQSRLSPKIGFEWSPRTNLHLRTAYTRSLGGVTYDNSVRLEPTQLAGFIQSYRSLVPESRAGLVPGTRFETFHAGLDHRFPTRTYVVLDAEWLRSDGRRSVGVFDYTDAPPFLATPSSVRERLDFEERSVSLGLHQLLGSTWAFSARYRLSDALLQTRIPAIPVALDPTAVADEAALLHRLDLAVLYQHTSGFFGSAEARWLHQDNRRDAAALRNEDLLQLDLWAGWRFARRRLEVAVGVLNVTDRNYRLNPLSAAGDLPHERLLATRLRWMF